MIFLKLGLNVGLTQSFCFWSWLADHERLFEKWGLLVAWREALSLKEQILHAGLNIGVDTLISLVVHDFLRSLSFKADALASVEKISLVLIMIHSQVFLSSLDGFVWLKNCRNEVLICIINYEAYFIFSWEWWLKPRSSVELLWAMRVDSLRLVLILSWEGWSGEMGFKCSRLKVTWCHHLLMLLWVYVAFWSGTVIVCASVNVGAH